MFLCASRLPSFAPRRRDMRGSANQNAAGGIFQLPPRCAYTTCMGTQPLPAVSVLPRCEIHPPLRCFAHAGPRLSRPHAFVAVRGLGRKLFGRSFERPTQFCRQKHAGVHERLVRSTQHSVSGGAVQMHIPAVTSADGVQ